MEFTDYFYIFAHMKDSFEGKEYEIITPSEGDIVRVNVHRIMTIHTDRKYFLVIWPPSYIIRGKHAEVFCRCINLGGDFIHGYICLDMDTDIFVKPTIGNIFEMVDKLRIQGYVYDRKSKKVFKR